MKSEKLIHIKFEYDSAIEDKRDILASEISLLKIFQGIKRYRESRDMELNTKIKVKEKLGELRLDIDTLQKILPEIEIPEILKAKRGQTLPEKIFVKTPENLSIETELQEIQRRLNALQG